jgi:hypothetical protein
MAQVIDGPRRRCRPNWRSRLRSRRRHAGADRRGAWPQHRRRGRTAGAGRRLADSPATHGRGPPPRQRAVQHHARRRVRRRHPVRPRRPAGLCAPAPPRRGRRRWRHWPPPGRPAWNGAWRDTAGRAPPGRPGRAPAAGIPAADLQPPPRRPEPALEPFARSACATPQGRRVVNYQGNWRDIFQNWEALAAQRAGLPGSMVDGLPGRDDARRLQPLPHRPRRHRLGSGGARQPLEPHRLLGRPPGGLPAAPAGGDAGARSRRCCRRCGTAHCSALPTCPTG